MYEIKPDVNTEDYLHTTLAPVKRLVTQAVTLVSPKGIVPTDTLSAVGSEMVIDIIASLLVFSTRPVKSQRGGPERCEVCQHVTDAILPDIWHQLDEKWGTAYAERSSRRRCYRTPKDPWRRKMGSLLHCDTAGWTVWTDKRRKRFKRKLNERMKRSR